jgi:hydrogenase maturation protein HypF
MDGARSAVAPWAARVRCRIRVRGVVQGVGFRPFVYRLAGELGLSGHVANDGEGVLAEVEGDPAAVARFADRVRAEAPPLARIETVVGERIGLVGEPGFRIVESRVGADVRTSVAPDVAVCDDCLRDLFDPADRRHRYPFVNCTNCGPRFTITVRLPYDRPNTTMAGFPLCDACAAQYHDPGDRRFHAQPIACPACGPRLWFERAGVVVDGTDAALAAATRVVAEGGIVAIKGLGGYHLACDATSEVAVRRLRDRKRRGDKPFAVMAPDLAGARRVAAVDDHEAALLTSPARPIVLLRRRTPSPVTDLVAPGSRVVGVMLPYTPLHHLLFRPVPGFGAPVPTTLVMTSGNLSDEPISHEDADARRRLHDLADVWLVHDRPIHVPCDDSVVRVVDGEVLPIRRSRGYAPLPVRLPFEVVPVLAAGGELKSAFAVARHADAWLSQHIGDMGSLETLGAYERSVAQITGLYSVEPRVAAADAHPGYQTRRWVETHGDHAVALVQHHHAHVAAVMVEHGVAPEDAVIGFVFDGTGYGTDGAIWGGEVLVAGYDACERAAHLRYVPLPGGDATIRRPYRAALAHLWNAGVPWTPDLAPVAAAGAEERTVLLRQLQRSVACVPTSSMGRLFDAVSSLLGIRHEASFEAQAAMELETVAEDDAGGGPPWAAGFARRDDEIDAAPVIRRIVDDLRDGVAPAAIAAAFHGAVAGLVADTAVDLRERTGIERVALTGGVFQNVLLVRLVGAALRVRGFDVLTHHLVPPNDGGLALGQVAVAGRSEVPFGAST